MKRDDTGFMQWRVGVGLWASGLMLGAMFVACGGRTQATTDSPDGGSTGPTTSPNDAQTWDGGLLASTPGAIRCGDTTCDPKLDYCCLRSGGDPITNGCTSRDNIACPDGSQVRRSCDQTSDCGPSELCCTEQVTSPPVSLGSSCQPASQWPDAGCGPEAYVTCGSDSDCAAVGEPSCVAQKCRGDIYQTCGLMPSEECDP
jgi:hypothetical protein